MKKCLIVCALLLTLLLAACGDEPPAPTTAPTAAPTVPPTELHTVAPQQSEPAAEWASVEVKLTLEDHDNLYAKDEDFICFALIGDSDHAELHFRLDEATAAMLREQSPENVYYLTMNEKKLGDVTLNESCSELTLVGEFSYAKLCSLANQIRGLE